MTKLQASIGGTPRLDSPAVGRQASQDWRQPPLVARTPGEPGIDWTSTENATPKAAPKRRFGKYIEPVVDVPHLEEKLIRVRSVPPATYYTGEGAPIPEEWVTLPITPGLLAAIRSGDLERGEDPEPTQHTAEHRTPAPAPRRVVRPTPPPAHNPPAGE